jgi:hypothetical protein
MISSSEKLLYILYIICHPLIVSIIIFFHLIILLSKPFFFFCLFLSSSYAIFLPFLFKQFEDRKKNFANGGKSWRRKYNFQFFATLQANTFVSIFKRQRRNFSFKNTPKNFHTKNIFQCRLLLFIRSCAPVGVGVVFKTWNYGGNFICGTWSKWL